jgi:hypothetical protein
MNSSVQLILKTTDIITTATNANYFNTPGTITTAIGQVSQSRTSMTWYNINIRSLLGDLYDKYERFNISLNFAGGSSTGSGTGTIPDNRLFQNKMKGLLYAVV